MDTTITEKVIEGGVLVITSLVTFIMLLYKRRFEQEKQRTIRAEKQREIALAEAESKLAAARAEAEHRNAESQSIVLRATMDAQNAINIGEQLRTQTEIIRDALKRQSDDAKRLGDQREQDAVFVAAKLETNTIAVSTIQTDLGLIDSKLDALPIKIAQAFTPASDILIAIRGVLTVLVDDVQTLSKKIEERQKTQLHPELSEKRDL